MAELSRRQFLTGAALATAGGALPLADARRREAPRKHLPTKQAWQPSAVAWASTAPYRWK